MGLHTYAIASAASRRGILSYVKPLNFKTYVSLFSAGGIADFGLQQAGFKCVASAELLSRRIEVQRLNQIAAEESLVCGDINLPGVFDRIISLAAESEKLTQQSVGLVLATPPCQGMSVANLKKGNEQKRNSLVVRSIEAIRVIDPLVFVFENVPSFVRTVCTGLDGQDRLIGDEIEVSLGHRYEFFSKTLNLQNYGSPSSRRRSLTIGVRNDLSWVTPLDLFPDRRNAPDLQTLIGSLPRLKDMGEVARDDPFHNFRGYDPRMRPWISGLRPGQSAFDNSDPMKRPHRIMDGVVVPNVKKNSDKYKRVEWNKVAPCVHTRNDILASQNTVHPEDDRVFSVRELMMMMGLPKEFIWFADQHELDELTPDEQYARIRAEEPNIRQCLGEAVPAPVMTSIGKNISKTLFDASHMAASHFSSELYGTWPSLTQRLAYWNVAEGARANLASYYTQPLAAFAVLKRAWNQMPRSKSTIRVLEPSCGSGVFIALLDLIADGRELQIDATDVDPRAVDALIKVCLPNLSETTKVKVELGDYLTRPMLKSYDLCIGNPPFGRKKIDPHECVGGELEISSRFARKAIREAGAVAFVFPKAMLHAAGYRGLRDTLMSETTLQSIMDFGEEAFPEVKVETIGFHTLSSCANPLVAILEKLYVKSFPRAIRMIQDTDYVCNPSFPTWLIYRSSEFDKVLPSVSLGRLQAWRDRKISRRFASEVGVRVIRGRNIGYGGTLVTDARDYCVPHLVASETQNKIASLANKTMFLAPNLSYYPRVVRYDHSSETVPEGSCAVLWGEMSLEESVLFTKFAGSSVFADFYRVVCNYATRSINIDSCLVFWWAVPKSATPERQS